jgi:nucleotidyltransferase/DNA polymerase involved in DNA repair
MTDLRSAAQQALEALEGWKDDAPSQWSTNDEKLITTLRAALAEEALQRLTDANQEIEAVLEQPEHGVTLKPVFYAPRRLSNEEVMAVIGPFRETEQHQVPKSTWQKLYEAAIDQRNEAAAELRRLHAENVLLHERHHFDNGVLAELLQALKDATDAIEHWGTYATDYFQKKWDLQSDINAARAAIDRAEGQV